MWEAERVRGFMCGGWEGGWQVHVFVCGITCHSLLRLRVDDNMQPLVSVEGFATYCDTCAEDLVPWTPLKAGELIKYVGFTEVLTLLITYLSPNKRGMHSQLHNMCAGSNF